MVVREESKHHHHSELFQPSTSISCVLESSFCWVLTEKFKYPICWDCSGPKKETRVMIMLWLPPQFPVERRKPQIFKNDWNDCSASGNHVTLVSVRWPWLHASRCLRGSWHSSGLENLLRHYLWLRMRSKNLIEICVSGSLFAPPKSGTNVLSQAGLASASFSLQMV